MPRRCFDEQRFRCCPASGTLSMATSRRGCFPSWMASGTPCLRHGRPGGVFGLFRDGAPRGSSMRPEGPLGCVPVPRRLSPWLTPGFPPSVPVAVFLLVHSQGTLRERPLVVSPLGFRTAPSFTRGALPCSPRSTWRSPRGFSYRVFRESPRLDPSCSN